MKNVDSIRVGDRLQNSQGQWREVLGICGNVVALSFWNQDDRCTGWFTYKYLNSQGYAHLRKSLGNLYEKI